MVLLVSSKVGLGNNYHSLNVYDVVQRIRRINRYNQQTEVRTFHRLTNMRQHVPLKTYSKFPLINKQPNAILKFCLIDIPLVQSWWQYSAKFGGTKFDIIYTKYMRVNLPTLNCCFFRLHCKSFEIT